MLHTKDPTAEKNNNEHIFIETKLHTEYRFVHDSWYIWTANQLLKSNLALIAAGQLRKIRVNDLMFSREIDGD